MLLCHHDLKYIFYQLDRVLIIFRSNTLEKLLHADDSDDFQLSVQSLEFPLISYPPQSHRFREQFPFLTPCLIMCSLIIMSYQCETDEVLRWQAFCVADPDTIVNWGAKS